MFQGNKRIPVVCLSLLFSAILSFSILYPLNLFLSLLEIVIDDVAISFAGII